jgi:hypothetical protein
VGVPSDTAVILSEAKDLSAVQLGILRSLRSLRTTRLGLSSSLCPLPLFSSSTPYSTLFLPRLFA